VAWKIILVLLLSGIKFMFAVPVAQAAGLSMGSKFICLSVGGCTGVYLFLYLSGKIVTIFNQIIVRFRGDSSTRDQQAKKKIFSRKTRFLVKFMKSYGLTGIAIITPPFLSIPLGSFIADRVNSKFIKNKKRVLYTMWVSVVAWALLISFAFELFS
jgi:hypothetical protein